VGVIFIMVIPLFKPYPNSPGRRIKSGLTSKAEVFETSALS